MSQLVDVRTVADSPLTSARTWPTAPLPRRGTDAGRLQHKSGVSRQAANMSAQAAHKCRGALGTQHPPNLTLTTPHFGPERSSQRPTAITSLNHVQQQQS